MGAGLIALPFMVIIGAGIIANGWAVLIAVGGVLATLLCFVVGVRLLDD